MWRAQLFRILYKCHPGSRERATSDGQGASLRIKRVAKILAAAVEFGPLRLLMREVSEADNNERREALQAILEQAAWLFIRLRTQRPIFQLDDQRNCLGKEFKTVSNIVEADALHKLEDSDHRLDKSIVGIVVFPAIQAHGDSNGESLDSYRVLSKAVVWLEEQVKH